MKFEKLNIRHYPALWKLFIEVEGNGQEITPKDFVEELETREGWVLLDNENIVGCISLSDYQPNSDVTIHATVRPQYHGKWANRKLLKDIANKVFNELSLPRVSSYSIYGITGHIATLLKRIGFRYEGTKRKAFWFHTEYKDLALYGMLREECKWV